MQAHSVSNGVRQEAIYASPQDFVRNRPRGAYTTSMVKHAFQIVDWPTHVERLIKSVAALDAALDGCFSAYYESIQASGEAEEVAVQRAVLPSVLASLCEAAKVYQDAETVILMIVLSPSQCLPLDVHTFACPCHSPATAGGAGGAWAAVLGAPRQVPVAKDSSWVETRKPLEDLRPSGVAEVLLCTQEGALLEGLITNLYIIERREDGRTVLITAGMGDGVVWGTIRCHVLQACQELRLEVEEKAPAAGGRARWREAFLTNSLRGVQPLGRITCDERNVWGLPPWEVTFSTVPGPWTQRIADKVQALVQCVDAREAAVQAGVPVPRVPPLIEKQGLQAGC